ncbi:hypothetical protein A3G67_02830 [Candidatus Roizmanbacteria bacterium RIFCSPLOWO2_12_FULL_40_12]|uniref:RCK N-terminal domain-containing protein n=1 Tax=Candidatus Roizmanbacteria bacterium RIFCSPLOWO2_01_FULL_40_42 TaxID=1802066 RepID=A0A1F7J2P0_9BACT|nr:MAG: hypothetical protein A2779_00360 [Candidatus Roizmanbacteria bacterium RIFCSPHIGHO2_01_FULL_40_98]OGK27512.1 MAG: hypothetical protein A3C31_03515 [Candidatus Roizmanbacteria bacterium RIFCSPHIGHO2_02_FULL_40_53]OGK30268.1 MAG: hypothetical protein A2W49_01000 [Candidatus Roizmanbacteria bacterium RIFCSPHIGHO2_12_41_18]OGK37132.1 MAG: hypothetical protein A3E69_01595 [Candidatus Roizmanbacteria bacterium RIFCSPHIGHO2_12_FULL_40_130]OGK49874.1 MAG: hypothetical protein A3B50_03755 [Candi
MPEIPVTTFFNYFLYLFIPFVFGFLAKKIKISPVIGYIIGGIALGNVFSGVISQEAIRGFAYFGIILLLFTVGLDINLNKITILKKFIVIGGTIQILLSLFLITVLSTFFGFSFLQSFLIGIALTSSSTSIVAKIIQDRGEESSFLGEVALGVLMFQDLAFIPFIIIFTFFNGQEQSVFEVVRDIGIGLVQATVIIWVMYFFGKRYIPKLFNAIAKTSRELLNLFVIVFIFMTVAISASLEVPVLIGAFMAGVLVSQTSEHYHIFSQIRPLRDLMAIIFFVYIGTHVKVPEVIFMIPKIALFAFLLVLIKALILLAVFLYFRFSSRMAFYLAIFLFQASENAFILLSLAFTNKILTSEQYLFVLTAVLMSLMFTPVLINSKDSLYQSLRSFLKKYVPAVELFIKHRLDFDQSPLQAFRIRNHVILCGYGRIGSQIGKALNLANIPFVAIDYNFHTVEKAKKEGVNIIYGDPTDYDVLDFAETEYAQALVIAVPINFDQEQIILNAKKLNSKIVLIGRVHTEKDKQRMKDLGVNSVVSPELEASLSIIKKLFIMKRMGKDDIMRRIRHIKLVQGII